MSGIKISSMLSRPVSILETPREKWVFIILSGLFSIFFINVFVPFNINLWWPVSQPWLRLLVLSGYAILGIGVLLISQFFLRPWFGPSHYRLWSFLLWALFELVLISIVISVVYEVFIRNRIQYFSDFILDVLLTIRYVGLVMCMLYCIVIPIMISRRQVARVTALQKSLFQHEQDTRLLTIHDENGKPVLSVPGNNLIYVKSEDNYVSVIYRAGDKIKKALIRSTLKKLENYLASDQIIRIHRSFMINMQNIGEVKRISRGFMIKMKHVDENIPVSPNYRKCLEEKIAFKATVS